MTSLSYQDLYDGFLYLDELREGGSINMYEAVLPLKRHLHLDKETAKQIWVHWTNTFNEEIDLEDRIDEALEIISNDDET